MYLLPIMLFYYRQKTQFLEIILLTKASSNIDNTEG